MKVICAWCKMEMGNKEALDDPAVSHGICPSCLHKLEEEMSYRCQPCRALVPAGQPRLIHVIKRANGQIAKEVLVCPLCHEALTSGKTLNSLTAPQKQEPEIAPIRPQQPQPAG